MGSEDEEADGNAIVWPMERLARVVRARERGRDADAMGPHLCMLFDSPLSRDDATRICISHEPAG